jgi:hypothetical protein
MHKSGHVKLPLGEMDYLWGTLPKAMSYAGTDPKTSLMHARKSAETICTVVFAKEIGDPGSTRLDKLMELLTKDDKISESIRIPLRVIQQYGNYVAHFQADQRPIDRAYIALCLSALIHVSNWYYGEYLGIDIPTAVAAANKELEPQAPEPPKVAIAAEDQQSASAELGLPSVLRTPTLPMGGSGLLGA